MRRSQFGLLPPVPVVMGCQFEGATMATVRAVGSKAGQVMEPCTSCAAVAKDQGVRTILPVNTAPLYDVAMNIENVSSGRMRHLIDGLDELLDVAGLERSNAARAKLAIALCDHLGERLGEDGLAAVNAAREFWLRGESVEYNRWFDLFSLGMNDQRMLQSIDRLVWSSLAQSGGLDSYAGQYLVLEAGLGVDDISAAIAEAVPGLSAG